MVDPGQVLQQKLVVVLVQPLFPGNVGAVARAMANFGLRELVLVDPPAFDFDRARWRAAGARWLLEHARVVGTVAEAVADCDIAVGCTARKRKWHWPTWEPPELATRTFDSGQRTAVLFGREDSGLDNDALSHCQALLRIPTGGFSSLNLGQAVLVVALQLCEEARRRGWTPEEPVRQGKRSGGAPIPVTAPLPTAPAPLGAHRAVLKHALGALQESHYLDGRSEDLVHVTLEMLLQRAQPTTREVEIMLGMLKKLRFAMANPDA